MANLQRLKLGELLVQRGILTAAQLEEALEAQERSGVFLGAILVSKGWASEKDVARALSEQLGLAYVDLASHPVEPEAMALVPEELCRTHLALPLFTLGDSLTVAMANPLNTAAIEELQRVSHKHIRPVFSVPTEIRRILDEGPGTAASSAAGPLGARTVAAPPMAGLRAPGAPAGLGAGQAGVRPLPSLAVAAEVANAEPVARMKAAASLAPVVQLVDTLTEEAVTAQASDIHLEPTEEAFACRFRIDGILHERPAYPKEYQAAVISRIKIMANMDISEKRLPQDGRVQASAAGRTVDLRVSTFPTLYGENVVIRILDKQRGLVALEELGLSGGVFKTFSALINKPNGIILVTGPTGSGKTTTLYAVLRQLNHVEKNVMTLEDPVEYELPGIRQSQVNVKAGLTFATGMRSLVRQDPDVILIGEIRDRETADIAIHASLTGHLVFATLHTNDAASASTRLVDIGVEPFLVATSLAGVLAQRLVRVLCPACKSPAQPAKVLLDQLGLTPEQRAALQKEVGCKRCRRTGYAGRLGLFELLVPNEKIREMIAGRTHAGLIRAEAVKSGMITLRQDGIEKLKKGITSLAEVLRVVGEA